MKYFEFGKENKETLVLLHGGGVCYRGAIPVAEIAAKTYHVILVAYDGFNPSEPETEFKSVTYEARRLGDYIVENFGGKIDILYGVSFGCRILTEVLADERLTVTTAIGDGMETIDYPNIKSEFGKNMFCVFSTGLLYLLVGKAGPRRKRFLAKIMGRTPESAERLIYSDATWKSWKNEDYCLIGRKINVGAFKNTDMYIWHGTNSAVERKLAKNIAKWRAAGYAFTYKAFPDVGHGGLAGEHTERMIEEVKKAHARSLKKLKRGEKNVV